MRRKLAEIPCKAEDGRDVVVFHWSFGEKTEFKLEDDTPVHLIGGAYENFYTGELVRPT